MIFYSVVDKWTLHTFSWFLQWCCSFRVQYKTDWNFGLLVVYIGENSPNRELSKRAQALGGSGVGSGRTNESFSAKNKLYWTRQNREGTEICIICRNHRCFSTKKLDKLMQSSFIKLREWSWGLIYFGVESQKLEFLGTLYKKLHFRDSIYPRMVF